MATSTAKKAVRNFEKVVDVAFILFLLLFVLYGAYAMWETNRMYHRASSSMYTAYRPTQDETLGFEELQEINPDVFGWLTIFGTNIDYPLVQGEDNLHYVHTNAKGQASRAGAIFLDVRNDPSLTDFNNIIYGHDMTRNAMFGELGRFQETYFFESRQFGIIFNGDRHYGIEFFSFLEVDAYDFEIYNPLIRDEEIKNQLISRLFEGAIQYRDIGVGVDDRLIVLSTCTPTFTNGRHLLIGRLMEEVPHDIFEGQGSTRGIDRVLGIGWFGLVVGVILVLLLTISITLFFINKNKKKKIVAGEIPPIEVIKLKKKKTTLKDDLLFLGGKLLMIGLMVTVVFTFVFGVVRVDDVSMSPSMLEGDIVLFQRLGSEFVAQDVIVVNLNGQRLVRRVVAVAGDTVDIHEYGLYVNGRLQQELYVFEGTETFSEGITFPITVGVNEVFVMGDSRSRSRDSRIYGTIPFSDIEGIIVSILGGRGW